MGERRVVPDAACCSTLFENVNFGEVLLGEKISMRGFVNEL